MVWLVFGRGRALIDASFVGASFVGASFVGISLEGTSLVGVDAGEEVSV